jgi:hypothetical protein
LSIHAIGIMGEITGHIRRTFSGLVVWGADLMEIDPRA